jgi:Arc/MetJ-type ribon-helix-helix transcriptional regulator
MKQRKSKMSKHRLQLDFTDKALGEIDKLRQLTGLPNRAEVIRQALRLLLWTLNETQQNNSNFYIEKDGQMRQIVIPFWPAVDERELVRQ